MGNGTKMTAGEKKISSQLSFNSFMTSANVYTNMKINKSMQQANALNKEIINESSKQTSLMEQDLAIKQKEQQERELIKQERELIKQVKESAFQINNELKELANEKDLLKTFISLESLYATMVSNNITTDIVPDLQDKEYIQNVYTELDKIKNNTVSNFSKKDADDKAILIDILEEDEESIIEEYESDEDYKMTSEIVDFVSNIDSKKDDDILSFAKLFLGEKHDFFTKIKEKKKGLLLWVLLMLVVTVIEFGAAMGFFVRLERGDNSWALPFVLTTVVFIFSLYKVISTKNHNKNVEAFKSIKFNEDEKKDLISIVNEEFSENMKRLDETKNKIKELKETIDKEIPMAKELVARRPFLKDLLKARAIDV